MHRKFALLIRGWVLVALFMGCLLPEGAGRVLASANSAEQAASRRLVQATVWPTDPIVPVLTYHQFINDRGPEGKRYRSTSLKINLSDFEAHLQALYEGGYSLVSLEDWLRGNMAAPPGRRPLVITLDDLFFNNQLLLLENGNPDPQTGIGVLWYFSQAHPDFGFKLALFATLGDKLYAFPDDPGWQDDLARAIAWCIDHGAQVYNHFYSHPRLDLTAPEDITTEARLNDAYLRKLLNRIGRGDLIPELRNLIALPYGKWPANPRGRKALLAYQAPEGQPLEGIFEIDFIVRPKFLLPIYSPKLNRWHLPRIVADTTAIEYLVKHQADFPPADQCSLVVDHKQPGSNR